MADKGWKNKEDKDPRRSPRKRGKMFNRPFKAPRAVIEERNSDVQVIDNETVADSESQVQIITETHNTRDIEGKHEAEPHVIPFVKGIKMMSERESTNKSFGAVFEKKARGHHARQVGATEEIKDTLNRNGRRSYASLEKTINQWCSKMTIVRYLKSNDDFITYSQNVRPLLSEGNRLRQVKFSEHVRNRWGLGSGRLALSL
jgi:hypothetical protein